MAWLVIALLAAGRFVEFFVRSDSESSALGLEAAQWTSLALLALAGVGVWLTIRRPSVESTPKDASHPGPPSHAREYDPNGVNHP
jgi:hypothetical protein